MFETAIVLLPLIGAVIAGLFGRAIGARGAQVVTCTLLGIGAVISMVVFKRVAIDGQTGVTELFTWIDSGVGAINSLNTMKTICRNLHCWVLPQEVSIANSSQTFNDDGTVKDPEIEERLLNVGRQLVKFASVQQRVQQDEFMKMWKSLPTW